MIVEMCFRLVVSVGVLTGLSSPIAFGCEPSQRDPSIGANVMRRLCPVRDMTNREILGIYGLAGQSDPDVIRLGLILNGLEREADRVDELAREAALLASSLQRNPSMRTGLRIIILQARFSSADLSLWCDWKKNPSSLKADQQESIAEVDEAVECELSE